MTNRASTSKLKSAVSWRAKLTPKQVRKIRRMIAGGVPQTIIAEEFPVSQSTISALARGLIYKKVA